MSNVGVTYFSPAKVNIFLRVLGKRPDQFHDLASLLQVIGVGDYLTYSLAQSEDSLTCTDPALPTNEDNLVLKAVSLFRRKTGITNYFRIHLDKQLPVQAGIGGGSGNAATTLWACNELCGKPASNEQLRLWSTEIGSDIALYFSQGAAYYSSGRGEEMQEVTGLVAEQITIVKPQLGLCTKRVFQALRVAELPEWDPLHALSAAERGTPICMNDLEHPVFELEPELVALKERLKSGGFSEVMLCGAGSSFLCLGEGKVPESDGLWVRRVPFLRREPDGWYQEVTG